MLFVHPQEDQDVWGPRQYPRGGIRHIYGLLNDHLDASNRSLKTSATVAFITDVIYLELLLSNHISRP